MYCIPNTHSEGAENVLCAEFVSYSFGLSDGQVDEVTDDY